MGPSPTIPTSFVPKQPVHSAARFQKSGSNILLLVTGLMLAFSLVGSVGVFAYGLYLDRSIADKAIELKVVEDSVNATAVEDFIRFRDRFDASGEVLDAHVSASNFFDLLEKMTLANVRFSSLAFEITEEGVVKIELTGTARNFNALAAQSKAFADEKLIKRAIFANITTSQTGTVSFSVSAELDPTLLKFSVGSTPAQVTSPASPASTTPSVPAATSTGPTSAPAPAPLPL